ncbi:hypothetical protein V2J09_004551 [Rumex salicifolius]
MGTKKSNGRVWLHKGWQDFVEKYSIKCGYLLVFRYGGRSNFLVQIFDLSTEEIEYVKTSHKKELDIVIKEEECDDGDDCPTENKNREMDNQSRNLKSGQNCLSMENKSPVLQRAKASRSQNPHFSVIMKKAYVTNNSKYSYMHIPKNAESYFHRKGKDDIYLSLKEGDGRVWTMTYYVGAPPHGPARIHSGWTKFSQENNLQEGDICTFELVSSTDAIFKVTILRKNDEEADKRQKKGCIMMSDGASLRGTKKPTNGEQIRKRKRSSSVEEKSTAIDCDETTFTVTMQKTHVQDNCRLNIPRTHSARYLLDQHGNEVFLHRLDGKTWRVKCYIVGLDARFHHGWKKFVVDNDLLVGDSCVFELFPRKPNHYNVAIFSGPG